MRGTGRRVAAGIAALAATLAAVLAGCGDGGGEEAFTPSFDANALCSLAEDLFAQEAIASNEQLARYQELAPPELRDPVDALVEAFGAAADPVAQLAVLAEDHIQAAIDDIHAFEEEHCGIPHAAAAELPPGVTQDIEAGAARVDVTAFEYGFELPPVIDAGRTSLVLTNRGSEAHFMLVTRLADGVTLDDLLAGSVVVDLTTFEAGSKLAAPGGTDEEALTLQLDAGEYAMLCVLPAADGTRHVTLGMAAAFTVR